MPKVATRGPERLYAHDVSMGGVRRECFASPTRYDLFLTMIKKR
jgi:hypothetical protein